MISEGNINLAVNYWGNSISTYLSELSQIYCVKAVDVLEGLEGDGEKY